jgi:hypothetical protein
MRKIAIAMLQTSLGMLTMMIPMSNLKSQLATSDLEQLLQLVTSPRRMSGQVENEAR